jgi:hypothetical protein
VDAVEMRFVPEARPLQFRRPPRSAHEAAGWWRRYLVLDGSSPWAARAKRALKYCEIQLAGSAS